MTPIGITRREFLGATASAIVVPSAFGAPSAAVAQGFAYAYVGTYTPNGGGIYLFESDLSSGALTQLQVLDDIRNPSWLALNPAQTRLYAVSEIDNFDGQHNGAVASYSICLLYTSRGHQRNHERADIPVAVSAPVGARRRRHGRRPVIRQSY